MLVTVTITITTWACSEHTKARSVRLGISMVSRRVSKNVIRLKAFRLRFGASTPFFFFVIFMSVVA